MVEWFPWGRSLAGIFRLRGRFEMVEYTDSQGQAFELPKMTLKLSAEMDKVSAAQGSTERFKAEYEFVKKALPKEYVDARLDGKRMEDVDLVELSVLYNELNTSYTKPVLEAQMSGANAQIEQMKPMLDAASSVASITKKPNRQVFRMS